MTVHIHRANYAKGFTQVANKVLRDERLSLRAKGLLVQLLSHEDGWQQSMSYSQTQCRDGKESIRSGFEELEAAGYAWRVQKRDGRGRWAYDYHVTDESQASIRDEVGGFTVADSPQRADRGGQTSDRESAPLEQHPEEEPLEEQHPEEEDLKAPDSPSATDDGPSDEELLGKLKPAPAPSDRQVYLMGQLWDHAGAWSKVNYAAVVKLNKAWSRSIVTDAMGRMVEDMKDGKPTPKSSYPYLNEVCSQMVLEEAAG